MANRFRQRNGATEGDELIEAMLRSVHITSCDSLMQVLCAISALRRRAVGKRVSRVIFIDGLTNLFWSHRHVSRVRERGASRPDERCVDLMPLLVRQLVDLVQRDACALVVSRLRLFGPSSGDDLGAHFLGAPYVSLIQHRVTLEQVRLKRPFGLCMFSRFCYDECVSKQSCLQDKPWLLRLVQTLEMAPCDVFHWVHKVSTGSKASCENWVCFVKIPFTR